MKLLTPTTKANIIIIIHISISATEDDIMDKVEREVDQEIVDLEDEIADTYNQGYYYYYTHFYFSYRRWHNG